MTSIDKRGLKELLPELQDAVERLIRTLEVRSTVLTDAEIEALTGYQQPSAQLRALQARGFHRAHRNLAGRVILERPHFEAVSRGGEAAQETPLLRSQREPRWNVHPPAASRKGSAKPR